MSKKRKANSNRQYPLSLKVKAVRLHLEEGYTYPFISEQTGAHASTIAGWVQRYKEEGEDGLKSRSSGPVRRQNKTLAGKPEVREKIIHLKKSYPIFGIKRISDLLRHVFFIKTSPETVRKTLNEEGLINKPRRKPRKNPQKPRRFERSTPNQMWQTDIFCFRLGGRNAYLLGFIDDYSRYIVGLGLYRSQTAENLLETYRQAIGEYGVPAEMLTDNGRQYTNWRGTTRFEKELKKDRIKHIKSQPHHPMTLGKIERFWKTIWTEFLDRCQFDSMETARERITLWIKYYNCRRPHQGIGSLCPADRYFEVSSNLRKVIENGVEENILEHALRGKANKPFYMVGRMNGQSVVMTSEKGKFQVSVDGDDCLNGKTVEENKSEQISETNLIINKESDHGNETKYPK